MAIIKTMNLLKHSPSTHSIHILAVNNESCKVTPVTIRMTPKPGLSTFVHCSGVDLEASLTIGRICRGKKHTSSEPWAGFISGFVLRGGMWSCLSRESIGDSKIGR